MPRVSKIVYNPSLSVAKNADLNQCSEDAIRYFIRTRGIDRRYQGKMNIIEDIKVYLRTHPDASKEEVAKKTKHGINQVKRYWDIVHGREELQPSQRKAAIREQVALNNMKQHKAYLDRLPIEFICEYLKERKSEERKEQKRKEQEEKKSIAIQEIKGKIDALVAIEHKNTERLSQEKAFLPKISKQDLFSKEKAKYDMSKYQCVAFRKKGDLWKGKNVDLGNMNGGFPFGINGITFPSSEHAYIFGRFSHNTQEHISIQKQLLENTNGYLIKKGIRDKYRKFWRKDWNTYNVEWMLYVVWQKVVRNKDFQSILLALPQGVHIIEDVSFKSQDDRSADYWGARNPAKSYFGDIVDKYLKLLGKEGKTKLKNTLLWDYCNVGTYEGFNVMGKILTYIKQCLHDGSEPDINYDLLKSKNIYFLGQLIDFDAPDTTDKSEIEPIGVDEPKLTKAKRANAKKKANEAIQCTQEYAYFYQDTPLSNWWTSPPIPHDGHSFLSSEGVFMYEKAMGMGDEECALKILEADTDTSLAEKERFKKVKKLGKQCKWDETIYIEKREEWMYTALTAKFKVDKAFRDVLMAEEYRGLTFVEASPWDEIWGIKSRATQAILDNGKNEWKGLNLLGKLLTRLRDEKLNQS